MGYLCKLCLTYDKDRTGGGWVDMGWQSEDRCNQCTDNDELVLATSPFAQRLREELKHVRQDRDRMILRMQKRQALRRMPYCEECSSNAGRLRSVTEAYHKALSDKEKAYDQWAEMALRLSGLTLPDWEGQ